ncbi:MIR motif-containing protein [Dunaliella salina]|uniref:MIR motif-containing protein n=1 Tax=Dunaliella salina TaxID=3046 RepID=A0ABQ7GNI1_DUNSA|nr:MIR motif-containing protein [Dunaliella salina]|eukprot:KAF5836128.1 MIR motif-containing protein [Dunaliella salina]
MHAFLKSYPPCTPGSVIVKGQHVRLQHSATRKWLHSHLHKSPLSGKQEVSAFGGDGGGDGGDVWAIDWDSKHKQWEQDTKIRLKHLDTGAYLYSHTAKYGSPIAGQQEACASKDRRDRNNEWQAAEGVYIPVMAEAASKPDGSQEEL